MNDNRGSALLYSLLIMATVTAISTVVGTLTIRELEAGRSTSGSVVAYYGAESALEAGLFRLTEERFKNAGTLSNALTTIRESDDDIVPFFNTELTVSIDSGDVEDRTDKITTWLEENETFQVDLYNPSGVKTNIQKIVLDWDDPDTDGKLEVTWTGWKVGSGFSSNSESLQFDLGPSFPNPPKDIVIWQNGNWDFYRVRVKAIKGSVRHMTIVPHKTVNGSDPVEIPAYVVAKATGKYRSSKQAVHFFAPWKPPSSALGDFVMFADKAIVKEFVPCEVLPAPPCP